MAIPDDTLTYELLRAVADVEPGEFSEFAFIELTRRDQCAVLERLADMIHDDLVDGDPVKAADSKCRDRLFAVKVNRLTPRGERLLERLSRG